ncbi:MAG: hypothetical protein ACYCZ6_17485 [Polaromonas sp.]
MEIDIDDLSVTSYSGWMTEHTTIEVSMPRTAEQQSRIPNSFFYGRVIGNYKDCPIYDRLTDNHGVVRTFSGIMSERQPIKHGSIIAAPGILYEIADSL